MLRRSSDLALPALALLALVLLAHGRSIGSGFIVDDHPSW